MTAILGTAAIAVTLLLALALATSKALVADGMGLDRALAALWFGAKKGEPISLIVAQWQAAGDVAGCRWCRFLSIAVETAHCSKQLDPNSLKTPIFSAARAGVLLVLLAALLWTTPLALWFGCSAIRAAFAG